MFNQPRGLTILSIFLFLIFGLQALVYSVRPNVQPWERQIISLIQPLSDPSLISFFLLITYLASWPAVLFLSLTIIIWLAGHLAERRKIVFLAAVAAAELITILTKFLVQKPRPAFGGPLVLSSYGFPSGHAMVGLVFYGWIGYFLYERYRQIWPRRLIGLATASLVILIGFSRLYLAVHWPGDILGGWLAGLAILIFSLEILKQRQHGTF